MTGLPTTREEAVRDAAIERAYKYVNDPEADWGSRLDAINDLYDAARDAGLRRAAEIARGLPSVATFSMLNIIVQDEAVAAILAECSEGSKP